MNLNKNRHKKKLLKYQDGRIVTIGKMEIYPFVYKRSWDLTQYNSELLEEYNLTRSLYVYIGSSDKYNVKDRCANWRNSIINNRANVSKDIKIFINNLKLFLELETNLDAKEIDNYLYYNATVIARHESIQGVRALETKYTSQYNVLDFFNKITEEPIILLSKLDSGLKDNNSTLSAKNHRKAK